MACKMLFFDYRESEEKFFEGFKQGNYDIKFFKKSLNELTVSELSEEELENTMIISVFTSSNINDNVISKFKNLRIISTRSTGHDHIDINCCIRKNIALINVDSYGTKAKAQFVLGMIMLLVRKYCIACKADHNPLIPRNFCGRDLDTMSIGVVGTGTVGATVCSYANCLGMKIFAYDKTPNKKLVEDYGVEYLNFCDLLKRSDIVVVLISYTKECRKMFSYDEFKQMKQDSYFINVARGELVDNEALLEVAKTGKFSGIGLDVVACQNHKALDKSKSEITSVTCSETDQTVQDLSKLPNVIITPDISSDTQESVNYILKTTFDGLGDFLIGGRKNRIF